VPQRHQQQPQQLTVHLGYLPWLWLRQGGSIWLLLPAAASLALFAWLLTLHDTASGPVYASHGGVYIRAAIAWLWPVDGVRPSA
jgi:small multidrug resistance family-3 protein